jgi:energy-coupling factor transport system ATP-binding protein
MENQRPIIEIKNLSYTYAATEHYALRNINLSILEGEYVGLLGLNGSGKTTLELCLNGVIPNMVMGEMEGEVIIDGIDTFEYPVREMAKIVGMVFDNPDYQLSQLSVAEEIALGLENVGTSYDDMRTIIAEVLSYVGLPGFEERSPYELSGGQQQRLMIAASLAMHPKILVMDEPTSNIDPIGKEEVFAVAARLNKERKMTVIIAEHEVEMMADYADRIIVLNKGEMLLNGTPEEVFSQVDVLQKVGLRPPQVTELTYRLQQKQNLFKDGKLPVTVDGAEKILELLKRP